jgi:hypothetical protein
MALVSVVIPTLDRLKLLLRAIDSVLRQTHQETEVIRIRSLPFDRWMILAYCSSSIRTL